MQSFKYAIRALIRRPGFSALSIMALALGLGANAAIFRVIDGVLLQPLPYPEADRILMPWEFSADIQQRLGFDRLPSSAADFLDYYSGNRTFERFASMRTEQLNLTGRGEPERIGAVRVSAEFFEVLGVQPVVGRSFQMGDEGRDRVVLIAHSLWRRSFGSDPGVSGRVVSLNGEPATILGVLPDWFRFPAAGELPQGFGFSLSPLVWTLDVLTPEQRRNRGGKSLALIGRLKRGVTASDAQADLAKIAADIARDFPGTNAGWTIRVMTLREQLVGSLRPALIALLTAVGLVLLIACANVANLLLVRTTARQREICLRYALGAPRSTLVWASLAESLLLAGAGGLAGLGIAWWMLRALLTMAPASLPAAAQAGLDWDVLVFTVVLSLVTGVLFGAVPAWHGTRYDTADGLREGSRGMVGGRGAARTRNALVVFEVALAVTLLIGSVLLVQTFVRLIHVNTGFRTDRILTMEIALPKTAYTPARASTFFVSLIERLAALPGVEAAGLTSGVPLSGSENLLPVTAEGQPRPQPGHEIISDYRVITAGYFEALGIPLLEGDSIQPSPDAPRVWINQTMARSAWPGRPAVGRRLKLTNYDRDAAWYTVAGVVGDTRYTGLDRALRPQVYVYFTQDPKEQMAIVLRSYGDPSLLVASARQAVQSLDPNQPIARVRTMEQIVTTSVANRRFQMALIGVFAVLAVALAVVGLYAVVSYSVAERIHEMGLRLALGARPANLVALVLGEGLRLVMLGLAIGIGAALVLTRFLETLLFGVDARDTITFLLAPAVLLGAALLGCLAPARRAMRVDPAVALRGE
ncbi:MAG TPA: ABC transporter permease [Vicinamibacterales bacterium]|nr:ABC transporter permease [Vicinamibacterales bacterium]